ncbi:phosphoribosylamine--glycine ligase [Candidatus Micrarchaeota archaeon]|nr:phosphoribosylamine--glycine ligase [Candidatus Micrarchaeota archaeon]
MKVLLVGNGAREHAIAERLAQDCELYAVMSKKNPAIAQLAKQYWLCDIEDAAAVRKAIAGNEFDLGFASPDATLAAGVSDVLQAAGMFVASPSKAASRIEWDKGFMRAVLRRHGVKGSPLHEVVASSSDALRIIKDYGDVAVKPLGLTGGKGVKVSGDHFNSTEEAASYAYSLIEKDGNVLIEEKMVGEEFTLQAFCDGSRVSTMPPVQDHKRAFEGDIGANTGGMGSYSTGPLLPFIQQSDMDEAKKVLQDVIRAMKKEGSPFTGVLYGQFMVTAHGIRVVEFNARFGDPEAINVLSLLEGSLTDTFLSMAEGHLDAPAFSNDCTVVKYLVPEGYPEKPLKDAEVAVDSFGLEECRARIYYASVYENSGKIMTTGSRAFGILGRAATVAEAERISENGCGFVRGPVWHRKDIGTDALIQRRVDHVRSLRVKP